MHNDMEVQQIYQLSPMQEGMLFHAIMDKESNAYYQLISYDTIGEIDVQTIEDAWNALIEKYAIFRTVFIHEEINKPMQVVLQERKIQIYFEDISSMTERVRENYIERYQEQEKQKGFNLSEDTLIRVTVLKTGPINHKIIWSYHHILMDGWSLGIVINDFFYIYQTIKKNEVLYLTETCPYYNYIKWLKKQNLEEGYAYWREYLDNYEQKIILPKDSIKIKKKIYQQKNLKFQLNKETTTKLINIARKHNVTINTIFQTIWGILLQKYNNTEDVVFGAVVSGRPSEILGIESAVGLFINTIPVRVKNNQIRNFIELIRQIQDNALLSEKFTYLSLAQIQSNSQLKNELIDHIIVFENYPLDNEKINNLFHEFKIERIDFFEQTNYNFNIIILPEIEEYYICFKYNEEMYSEYFINKIRNHFINVIRQIVEDPEIQLAAIEILTKEERRQILVEFNDTASDHPKEKTIQELFEEQVERTPENIAMVYENQKLSYWELNRRANQLAHGLRSKGVGPENIVGIMVERSFEMIIGIMGILKAGGSYLPIDPEYPEERIKYMLEDSKSTILLTLTEFANKGDSISGITKIDLKEEKIYSQNDSNLEGTPRNTVRNLAYVIYTSGSTGKPKGVLIEHINVINTLLFLHKLYPLHENDAYLLKTTYTFDVSVAELFGWFIENGRLVILKQGAERDPQAILESIAKNNITHINFVPSMLQVFLVFLRDDDIEILNKLRYVFVAGEAISRELVNKFYQRTKKVIFENLYGPTESTVYATKYSLSDLGDQANVPIGKPLSNIKAYVIDRSNKLLPIGIAGELCLGGSGLARGYRNLKELTEEKFVPNPFEPGERMYRTGDLARWLPDGNIEFLGRIDHQVKIRGFRIELGEIESRLLAYETIMEAVVVAKESQKTSATVEAGIKYLCAYIVAEQELTVSELREYLGQSLPEYMIPSYFVQLEKLPLNRNGKIDRKALPKLEGMMKTGTEYEAPADEIEARLAEVWREVLGIERIGVNNNFFELGGHSLKATILASKIHQTCNVEVPLREIFQKPTIRELARYIAQARQEIYTVIEPVEMREYYPVSSAQKRLLLLDQFESDSITYNMPTMLIVEGELDKFALERAFQKLINRHESLRTCFEFINGEPVQRILPAVEFTIEYCEAERTKINQVMAKFVKPFDLNKAPLLRIRLVSSGINEHILMFDMHHIISDGISLGILIRELAETYQGKELLPLQIQYKDYAVWQNEMAKTDKLKQAESYWVERFQGELPVLNLPLDYPRPAFQSSEGNRFEFTIEAELTWGLKELAQRTNTTLYMILLAGFNLVLSRYTGQEDIIIGSPVAGRSHADLQNIIGMFVNTLAIRNYPVGTKSFLEFLEDVKRCAIEAHEHQAYQFEELVEKVQVVRDLSRNPLFDVMFALQNMELKPLEIPGLQFKPYEYENRIAKFDLTLLGEELADGICFNLEYCSKLFTQETIQRFAGHYQKILREIAVNPVQSLAEMEMLTEREKRQLLYEFNDTAAEYPKEKTIQGLFEEQVKQTPNNIAVVYETEQLTYRELNQKANQLAHCLRSKGVGPDNIVGLMSERSLEMIIGIMGILKAGGAYLPIDPEYPKERIEFMLKDSGTKFLLTQTELTGKLDPDITIEIIELKSNDLYKGKYTNIKCITKPTDLAYVIYTSGTTGVPKGVLLEHRGILNINKFFRESLKITHGDRVLQFSTISFDASVWEIFMGLLAGLSLYIPHQNTIKDIRGFEEYLNNNEITVATLPPPYLVNLDPNRISTLVKLITAGSVISIDLFNQWKDKVQYFNAYGPTETTICATIWKYGEQDLNLKSVPIGSPILNTRIYILDKNKSLQPIGIPGELYVSGDGLARGYLKRPELTQEKFEPNPFEPGERMYRTGDLARWLPDGNIEFLGRIDHQVKIRGFRIELGEIESQLLSHAKIKEAIVIAKDHQTGITGESGAKYLCAYIVAEQELTIGEVRDYLGRALPEYMIPSYFVQLEELPMNQNGKIDTKVLPEPEGMMKTELEYEAPADEIEARLVEVWGEVLGVEQVGTNANFFELGGDSIKAIQIIARLKKHQLNLEIKDLFKYHNIKEIKHHVHREQDGEIEQGIVTGEIELTPIQEWFFEQKVVNPHHFNQAAVLYNRNEFDKSSVKEVFVKILEHHDALRMIYGTGGNRVSQYIRGLDEGDLFTIEETDLTGEPEFKEHIEEEMNQLHQGFDLAKGPLVKIKLFKTNEGDYLGIVIHHLVVDGVSWRILLEDFTIGYEQALNNKEIRFQSKTSSFKDWASRLREYATSQELLQEMPYWGKLDKEEILELPLDEAAIDSRNKDSEDFQIELTVEETGKLLKQVNRAYNTEINDILLTALGLSIKEWTGVNQVLLNLEGHGREQILEGIDINRTVGWFTSMYPVILDLKKTEDLSYVIKSVKESLRRIPNRGIGYGILKYLTPKEKRPGLAFAQKPEISFNYLGEFGQEDGQAGDIQIADISSGIAVSLEAGRFYKLDINGMIIGKKLTINFSYNLHQYRRETIAAVAAQYHRYLLKLIEHCLAKSETELTPSDLNVPWLTMDEFEIILQQYPDACGRVNIQSIYRLTPMQEGILFHSLYDSDSTAYFEQITLSIQGKLKRSHLQKTLDILIERYDVFRTGFINETPNQPLQAVLQSRESELHYEDFSDFPAAGKTIRVKDYQETDRKRGFDLAKDCLIRISILRLGETQYELIWSFHHIIMDGWCIGIVNQEFWQIYQSLISNVPIRLEEPKAYGEYIKWLAKQDHEKARQYWQEYLRGFETRTEIPRGTIRQKQNYLSKEAYVNLGKPLTNQLETVSRQAQVTLNIVFEAIWGLLLQRYNNTNDVVFGLIVAGRPPEIAGVEIMVGLFINAIPVRVGYAPAIRFSELLKSLQETALLSNRYSYLSVAEIQANTEFKSQLFGHILAFENYPLEGIIKGNQIQQELMFAIEKVEIFEQTNYDFNIQIIPGEEITIKFSYNGAIYDPETVESIGNHIRMIARQVVENTDLIIKDIEILTPAEKKRVLYEFNDTATEYPKEKTIQELFEEQVERTPENIAVVYGTEQLTYRELNRKANQLAHSLRSKGVESENIVGIMVDRSLEMVIGIMGILKAGGAYLPVAPEYPQERIQYMMNDSGMSYCLTQTRLLPKLSSESGVQIIDLQSNQNYGDEETNIGQVTASNNLAYIIYTSGTTGTPKGVMVEHRSLINLCYWHNRYYGVTAADRATRYADFGFDASVWELFPYLIVGASVYIIPEELRLNPAEFNGFYKRNHITISFLPTQICEQFMELDNQSLRKLLTGGDKLTNFRKRNYELVNNYGPTENTVVTTAIPIHEPGPNLPIGKPVHNCRVFIVDQHLQLQPPGIPGELCIAGDGLARGYLKRPELTQEKFVPNPFKAGERMYRTGDLARWLPDGNIEFLGRIDNQVKIRGFRIELGEIESRLLTHEMIKEAVVVAKDHPTGATGDKYLCAYFVAEEELTVSELRDYLALALPVYMIPTYFRQLPKLPLTANGKIDRKALPEPEGIIDTGVLYVAPRNEIEETLAAVWRDLLGIERVGINDDFFELGGHSLKATILASKIHQACNVEVPLREIFQKPTVSELARYITEAGKNIYSAIEPVSPREYYPVSSAQKRLLLLDQFNSNTIAYNIPAILMVEGEPDQPALERAFQELIKRHESLRTCFEFIDGEPAQRILPAEEFAIEYAEADKADKNQIIAEFVKPFDLSKASLVRIKLVKTGLNEYLLMFDMHHIISDGTSMGILIREFAETYQGKELLPLRIQYKDYAVWQNKQMGIKGHVDVRQDETVKTGRLQQAESYWLERFQGELPVLNLPLDYPRPALQSFEGNHLEFKIEAELAGRLKELAGRTNTTLYMVLLAGYNVLLAKYTGQEDIIIGTPIAGRPHADLHNIIGIFINTLAMRNYPVGTKSFLGFLDDVKQCAIEAYEHQDYQFEELVEKVQASRDLSRNPLFDVMFTLQNMELKSPEIPGIKFEPYKYENRTAKFDLTLVGEELEDGISFSLEYCSRLFSQETIQRLTGHYQKILWEIAVNPVQSLLEIEMLTDQEKRQLLYEFNDTATEYPKEKTIQELFEEQVERTPENIAVVYGTEQLTYRELNRKANQLAHSLRSKGVESENIVGIMVDRSLEMVIGIMGILKAGGAYLPVAPEYPQERIQYMMNDSGMSYCLTQTRLLPKLSSESGVQIIDLQSNQNYGDEETNIGQVTASNNLAYIIYTSGTTGTPKGVMVEHRSLINLCYWHNRYYGVTAADRATRYADFGFDASVWELFPYLIVGASVYIIPEELRLNPAEFNGFYKRNHITISFLPTQICEQFMELDNQSLRKLLTGGDKLTNFRKRNYELVNNYGPTENTVVTTAIPIHEPGPNLPIGKPVHNCRVFIVDQHLQLQPPGIPGELCIAGDGLARGYLKRPELTQEKFVPNPFKAGERMYRTGDLARWLPDGNIEFLGRIDNQVKIRGFRIELGEIESRLLTHEMIKEAVVVAKDHPTGATGNKYLCAYFVTEEELTVSELRDYLAHALPVYMIPTYFIQLEKLPLNQSGKIDRKALAEPSKWLEPDGTMMTGTEYELPTDKTEEQLAEVWREVLGIERLGITDNFFELGGDSIKAIQIIARLKKYRLDLEIKDLFKYHTIKEIKHHVRREQGGEIEQGIVTGEIELTPIQKWFFEQKIANPDHFNQAVVLNHRNGFDKNSVKKVFEKILDHHDALRTIYRLEEDKVSQCIRGLDEGELFTIEEMELTGEPVCKERIEEEMNQLHQGFNLAKGPLVKVKLFKTNEGDYIGIVIHHLVVDGVSWRILLEDFAIGYEQALNGKEIRFQSKTSSFKDWASRLREYATSQELLQEMPYWGKLDKEEILELPLDEAAIDSRNKDSEDFQIELTVEETGKLLKQVNRAYNTEINDILLTALGLSIKEWTGVNQVLLNLEGHGREQILEGIDINRTVGWFTSMYPVILDLKKTEDLSYVIKSVKESLRRIPNRGIGYGILKYLTPKEKRPGLAFAQKPEISFNYLGEFGQEDGQAGDIQIADISSGIAVSLEAGRFYKLDINGMIIGKKLTINFSYNLHQYRRETIAAVAAQYHRYLLKLIEHCLAKSETELTPSDLTYNELSLEQYAAIASFYDEK